MAVEKAPAFQFYPKDFLSDRKQVAMSLAEAGAYWRLCCHCWMEGSLPTELQQLARLCGATPRQMRAMWPAISPCFLEKDGALVHKRLEQERDKQAFFRRRASDGGRSKAASKQPVSSPQAGVKQPASTATSPAKEVLNECEKPALLSPISTLQEERTHTLCAPAREGVALAGQLPRDHLRHAWCSSRGKCVPEFLHGEFVKAVGGDEHAASQRLKVWYEAVEHSWPEGPIGDKPVDLWRKEFAAKFPSVAPSSAQSEREWKGLTPFEQARRLGLK